MFLKNITSRDIALSSFEGYRFLLPPGVSWIWDKAGMHLLTNIYPERPKNFPRADIYGMDNGNGVQPVQAGTEAEWNKEGKKLAQVSRFMVNHGQIPRKMLIPLARERGVDNDLVVKWLADDSIDVSEIGDAINALPIPEAIRFPKQTDDVVGEHNNDQTKE